MKVKEKKIESKINKSYIYAIGVFIFIVIIGLIKLLSNKVTYSEITCDGCEYLIGPDFKEQLILDEWLGGRFCPPGATTDYYFFANYVFIDDECLVTKIEETNIYRCVACNGTLSKNCIDEISDICGEGWFESNTSITGGLNITEKTYTVNDIISGKPNPIGNNPVGGKLYGLGTITRPSTDCSPIEEVVEPTCQDTVYNGTVKTLVKESDKYNLSSNYKQTEPGTYKITVSLKDKNKYIWKNSGKTDDLTLNCKITELPKVEEPTCQDAVYDGSEKTLVKESDKYNLSSNYKQTEPGTYQITVSLKDKNKYIWKNSGKTDDLTLNCKITELPKVEEPTCQDAVYDGSEKTLVKESDKYTLSSNYKQTEPGIYQIKISLKEGYIWKNSGKTDDLTLKCEITKPKKDEVVEPTCQNTVYDGTEKTLVKESDKYTLSNNYKQTKPGTYNITATLKDGYVWKNSGNSYDLTLECEITEKPKVDEPTCQDAVYDGSEKTLVKESNKYNLSDNYKQTKPGIYKITVSLKDGYVWKNSGKTDNLTLNCEITNPSVEITENPKTGTLAIVSVWIIGLMAFGYAYWYYNKVNKREE